MRSQTKDDAAADRPRGHERAVAAGDWPAGRDGSNGVSNETGRLKAGQRSPPLLWKVDASAAVTPPVAGHGRIYMLGTRDRKETGVSP